MGQGDALFWLMKRSSEASGRLVTSLLLEFKLKMVAAASVKFGKPSSLEISFRKGAGLFAVGTITVGEGTLPVSISSVAGMMAEQEGVF